MGCLIFTLLISVLGIDLRPRGYAWGFYQCGMRRRRGPLQYTMFVSSTFPPDLTSQPLLVAAILLLYACRYLPHAYVLKLAFVHVVIRQAWYCAVGLDFSVGVARSLGRDRVGRLNQWDYGCVVCDSFSKYVFFFHAFCSGWDNRSCTEVP